MAIRMSIMSTASRFSKGKPMDDGKIYELLSKLTSDLNENLSDLRVQLQEVATKLDERHALYEERHAKFDADIDGAFKRIRKIEADQVKTMLITSAVTTVATALVTAGLVTHFIK